MMQKSLLGKKSFDLSPEIHALAKQEELGELRKVYPVFKRATGIWTTGQVCVAWGIVILGITALMIAAIFFFPSPPSLIFTLGVALSGLLLLLIGCFMSFSRRIYAHWQVFLWQYGFIYEQKQICQVFRWDQIEAVQRVSSGPAKIVYGCQVCRRDGYEVKLVAFSDLSELIDVVLEEAAYHLGPQELSIVSPKRASTFTVFKLDQQGVSNAQETLSWQEIQEFMPKNGTVTLLKKIE